MKEFFDIYNGDMMPTGRTFCEQKELKCGEYGLLVHIIIRCKGKYLLQQRALCKKYYPGQWDATCGKVRAGESAVDGAIREVYEELGIKSDKSEYTLLYKNIYAAKVLLCIFLLEKDFDLSEIVLKKDEVADVKLCTLDEMIKILAPSKNSEYIDVLYNIE